MSDSQWGKPDIYRKIAFKVIVVGGGRMGVIELLDMGWVARRNRGEVRWLELIQSCTVSALESSERSAARRCFRFFHSCC